MTYDADSHRTVLSDWTGLYTSAYDPDGRLSSVVNPAGIVITYNYDAVSQRAWMAQPTGTFTYVYDPVGRISNLTNPESQVTTWSYDAANRVTAQLLANGVRVSNTYDDADRLLLLANLTSTGTTLSSFNYAYNAAGNRSRVLEADGSVVSWNYDPTYQLTNEQRSGANSYNITYTYDAVGNRTVMVNNGVPTTYTYNAANELATNQGVAGVTTYTFDGCGNLLTSLAPGGQLTTNTWDGESRLTQVALPSGTVDVITYNGDGQRVQKQDLTNTTRLVWDAENVVIETDGANVIQALYTLEPTIYGNVLSQSRGGQDSYYLFDVLGSARQLVNAAGTVTDTYLYDSSGDPLNVSGSTTNWLRYVGRFGCYSDLELATDYMRARIYDPSSGRFSSRDPARDSSPIYRGNISSGYDYAANNFANFGDPSGLAVTIIAPTQKCANAIKPLVDKMCKRLNATDMLESGGVISCLRTFCERGDLRVFCPSDLVFYNRWYCERRKFCAFSVPYEYIIYWCALSDTDRCNRECILVHELVHICGYRREQAPEDCESAFYGKRCGRIKPFNPCGCPGYKPPPPRPVPPGLV